MVIYDKEGRPHKKSDRFGTIMEGKEFNMDTFSLEEVKRCLFNLSSADVTYKEGCICILVKEDLHDKGKVHVNQIGKLNLTGMGLRSLRDCLASMTEQVDESLKDCKDGGNDMLGVLEDLDNLLGAISDRLKNDRRRKESGED